MALFAQKVCIESEEARMRHQNKSEASPKLLTYCCQEHGVNFDKELTKHRKETK